MGTADIGGVEKMQAIGALDELEAATLAAALSYWRNALETEPGGPFPDPSGFVDPTLGTLTADEVAEFQRRTGLESGK
jgi:hypothetical protein